MNLGGSGRGRKGRLNGDGRRGSLGCGLWSRGGRLCDGGRRDTLLRGMIGISFRGGFGDPWFLGFF